MKKTPNEEYNQAMMSNASIYIEGNNKNKKNKPKNKK